MSSAPRQPLAVVIVAYRSGDSLVPTLSALSEQLRERDELVVVDNHSEDDTVETVRRAAPSAKLLELERNVGFAGGCNAGAQATTAPLLLFLNPDAVPAPGCLDALRSTAEEQPGWAAWQALVTLPGGERINTSGGVTHFLGVGWSGCWGEPVSTTSAAPAEVSFASGAALTVRRDDWLRAGGFDERFFMYCEDLDLSLRLRLAGRAVGVVPAARVQHEYEFAKGERKWFLLERNRAWTVLADYPGKLLVLLAPALLAFELALLAFAARDGWLGQKLRAQRAVMQELPSIIERRRAVQRTSAIGPAEFARQLGSDLDSPVLAGAARLGPLVAVQHAYWRAVKALL